MNKTLNDYIKKPKKADYRPEYNEKGVMIETREEIENWKKI
jgi:hypothetical protein